MFETIMMTFKLTWCIWHWWWRVCMLHFTAHKLPCKRDWWFWCHFSKFIKVCVQI